METKLIQICKDIIFCFEVLKMSSNSQFLCALSSFILLLHPIIALHNLPSDQCNQMITSLSLTAGYLHGSLSLELFEEENEHIFVSIRDALKVVSLIAYLQIILFANLSLYLCYRTLWIPPLGVTFFLFTV